MSWNRGREYEGRKIRREQKKEGKPKMRNRMQGEPSES